MSGTCNVKLESEELSVCTVSEDLTTQSSLSESSLSGGCESKIKCEVEEYTDIQPVNYYGIATSEHYIYSPDQPTDSHTEITKQEYKLESVLDKSAESNCLRKDVKEVESFIEASDAVGSAMEQNVKERETLLGFIRLSQPPDDAAEYHRCPVCQTTFSEFDILKRHIQNRHVNEGQLECTQCEKTYSNEANLVQHIKRQHLRKNYKCSICQYSCNLCENLELHVSRAHKSGKSYDSDSTSLQEPCENIAEYHRCPVCQMSFSEFEYLKKHIEDSHLNTGQLECIQCEKIYSNESNLVQHFKRAHDGKKYKCDMCPYTCNLSENLKIHSARAARVHDYEKLYRYVRSVESDCWIKDVKEEVESEIKMSDAISSVMDQTDLEGKNLLERLSESNCLIKREVESDSETLSAHSSVTEQPDEERETLLGFSSSSEPPKGTVEYHRCPVCGTIFSEFELLKRHIQRRHVNERQYQCTQCEKVYTTRPGLMLHTKREHDNTKFKCDKCSCIFNRCEHLKVHISIMHDQKNPYKSVTSATSKCQLKSVKDKVKSNSKTSDSISSVMQQNGAVREPLLERSAERLIPIKEAVESDSETLSAHSSGTERTVVSRETLLDLISLTQPPDESAEYHKCPVCVTVFSKFEYLKKHIKHRHLDTGHHQCTKCGKVFDGQRNLESHIKHMHETRKYKCDKCPYRSNRSEYLQTHISRAHDPKKPYKSGKMLEGCTTCSQCNKTFTAIRYLRIHVKIPRHQCPHCDKSFCVKRDVYRHIRQVHGATTYHCELCDYYSKCHQGLKSHIASVHLEEKSHQCPHCDSTFSQKGNLTRHVMAVHKQEKPHSCSQCNYKCSFRATLKHHEKAVHNGVKPFTCEECDYRCAANSTLKKHMLAAHCEVKPYKCDECDKSFGYKWSLKAHIDSVHGGHRPYSCIECDREFSRKSQLQEHVKAAHVEENL